MAASRKGFGQRAEDQAVAYFAGLGYTLVARNWRTRAGEIDIVAQDGDCLVLIEVRARHGEALGSPEESITGRKRARLAQMGQAYVFDCQWDGPWRIDVLALQYTPDGALTRLNHVRDAIEGVV